MEKIIDGTILIFGIGLFIIFLGLVICEIVSLSKKRAAARKRLDAAFDFASVINGDETKSFYNFVSSLIDVDGKVIEFPSEIGDYELIFSGFILTSQIPQHCCCIAVDEVKMKHDEFGKCLPHEPVQFFLRPRAALDRWTVISVSDESFVCKHPVMGELELPKEVCVDAVSGSELNLVSVVEKASPGHLLRYMCV